MTAHANSLAALSSLDVSAREREVIELLREQSIGAPAALTDRHIADWLRRHPYVVRPRITALIQRGLVRECGSCIDDISGRRVRLVTLA